MLDELLISVSRQMEHDLWGFVADALPDTMVMQDLCALAAQLRISRVLTLRDGCALEQARSFVVEADNLAIGIEILGARVAGSCLADASREANDFATVLLDLLVARGA